MSAWGFVIKGALALGALHMGSKLLGNDPDFTRAYMLNTMSGRGGFLKTYFTDGCASCFLGTTRSQFAAIASGNPMAAMLYANPYMASMNPYMSNPFLMGQMPYNPMAMGQRLWC